MKQQIIGRGQGQDYDWSNDHIFVKATLDLTGIGEWCQANLIAIS